MLLRIGQFWVSAPMPAFVHVSEVARECPHEPPHAQARVVLGLQGGVLQITIGPRWDDAVAELPASSP